jgi:hypothetical protein
LSLDPDKNKSKDETSKSITSAALFRIDQVLDNEILDFSDILANRDYVKTIRST